MAIAIGAPPSAVGPTSASFGSNGFALSPSATPTSNWPTYLHDAERTSDQAGRSNLSIANASHLGVLWSRAIGGPVYASPAVVGQRVYVGSWNGYEYALNGGNGSVVWKTFLGVDHFARQSVGITSSATVLNGVVYVGGGDSYWYALSASTGHVLWKVNTGNTSQAYYNWASPLIVNGHAYIGIASRGDTPPVLGGLLEVSLTTHAKLHFLNTTQNGTLGASIWTSPAYGPASGSVFVTTGNPGPNGSVWAESILAVDPGTLRVLHHWTVPALQASPDGDFGATPTVFNASGHSLVAAANKNGILYVWNESNLNAGPLWQDGIAVPSPLNGTPNLGPTAVGGGRLYSGSSETSVGGKNYSGAVRGLAPLTGHLLWQVLEAGPVLGAPAYTNGVLVIGAGHALQVLNAQNGSLLFQYNSSAKFVGAVSIAGGRIYAGGNVNGTSGIVYSFGPKAGGPRGSPPSPLDAPRGAPSPPPNVPMARSVSGRSSRERGRKAS